MRTALKEIKIKVTGAVEIRNEEWVNTGMQWLLIPGRATFWKNVVE